MGIYTDEPPRRMNVSGVWRFGWPSVTGTDRARRPAADPMTIGYLERGESNPSLELALRIAEHFSLPVEAIFSRTPFLPMSQQLYATQPSGDSR
jgi:putative transcriptional regulator